MCSFRFPFKKEEPKTNYGKIFAITFAVVAGVSAIATVLFALYRKYTQFIEKENNAIIDDCDDFLFEDENDEAEAEEAEAETEEKKAE